MVCTIDRRENEQLPLFNFPSFTHTQPYIRTLQSFNYLILILRKQIILKQIKITKF